MENTTKFNLPDFNAPKEEPKKRGPKQAKTTVEKPVLPRVNRYTKCAFCQQERVHNPDQYQKRFDYFGSDEAILRHWKCQDCETEEKDNPIKFWFKHSSVVNDIANSLKPVFETFVQDRNVQRLQDDTVSVLTSNKIFAPNFEFLIANQLPDGLKINFPFIGNVIVRPMRYLINEKVTIDT